MKKGVLFFLVSIIGMSVALCQDSFRETRNVRNFNRISFSIAGTMNIKIGPEFSVVLEGDRKDVEEVETDVSNGRLIIKHDNWRFRFYDRVDVYITMPELNGLGVSGSGKVEIKDDLKSADLDLSVSGSGRIVTSGLDINKLGCSISGSGNIILGEGTAGKANLSISGSGNLSGDEVKITSFDVGVSGSGNCTCYVTGSLEASISGSGHVTYKGNPSIDARVSGSGHVRSAR